MSEDKYKIELEQAYHEFKAKVTEAKKEYHFQIDEILKNIDSMKVAQIKKNLDI